ncbi:MAG TPA: phosphoglycerate dehydrogenase [Clostridiaceae bacterium]|nr:phosphoglycerate dehydrogenase [Clostridiaceae bacterium]
MFHIKNLNNISEKGLEMLTSEYTITKDAPADGILLRSCTMHGMALDDSVKVIARAGAGVNNIPIEEYAEQGIIVCNTPGANANAVKEMVILGLLLSSRKVVQGINWAKSIKDEEDPMKLIEKEKNRFAGLELTGKKIGVIGLGAIGVLVANTCRALRMEVYGYDPFISVNSAWGLSYKVKREQNLDRIIEECDYITLHVPLIDQTKSMITGERLMRAKKGMKLLNFSRGGLVRDEDIKSALESGNLSSYVTDFPNKALLGMDDVICIPHLGASTAESEENCAVMAVNSVREYLENGNILNSVNYPECGMGPCESRPRLSICNRNVPNMVSQITRILGESCVNIAEMKNQSKGNYAYTLIDTDGDVDEETLEKIRSLNGILKLRVIQPRPRIRC